MSRDNQGTPYKQRFKGLENFLRRVAFNLGNTPSQTEVKIISCIPIDVTDLQQKINSLERQLREVRTNGSANNPKNNRVAAIVQTALGKPNLIGSKSKEKKCEYSTQAKVPVSNHGCNTKINKRGFKRNISKLFVVSSFSSDDNTICRFAYSDSNIVDRDPSLIPERVSRLSSKIIRKRLQKVLKKKPRRKTHLVYFAQALNSPFNNYIKPSDFNTANKKLLSRAYINKMIRKQYEPELIGDRLTDISQFSSPVCRDTNNRDSYPSDISCTYGKYENLDKCYPKANHINIDVSNNPLIESETLSIHSENDCNNYNRYYNSDDYDMYPVKEKSIKQKKEDVPSKQVRHEIVNLGPLMISNDNTNRAHDDTSVPCKIRNKNAHEFTIANIQRKKRRNQLNQEANSNEPKVCCIDYGDVYVKRTISHKPQRVDTATPTFKNAECITENTNTTECQTVESKGVQLNIPDDNKAELALNQIKTILQSVLAEVKSNIKNHNIVSRPKKDVVIQKDISHNNITYGSTLLNSFNYNPSYNINPCLAAYARQIPNFCYANIPPPAVKCLQNFPLIFPSIKHHDFECQHKDDVNTETDPMPSRPAIAKATNTDAEAYTSPPRNETMNLIKEIYKSIALNVNYSSKNTSHISIGYPKRIVHSDVNTVTTKELTILEQSREEKGTQSERPAAVMHSSITNDDVRTQTTSNTIQTEVSTESERFVKVESLQTTAEEEDKAYNTSEPLKNEAFHRSETKHENDTRSSTSGSACTNCMKIQASQKKTKTGLLQKMFETVKMLKKKNVSNRIHKVRRVEGQKTSDSDTDTQTIYSYKTYRDRKPSGQSFEKPSRAIRRECLKEIVETDRESGMKSQESSRKPSPYMEQEYRRYWDEKLMFNENKSPMHFSEKSYSGRAPENAMFWRGYEARSAILKKRFSKTLREQYRTPIVRPEPFHAERTGLKLEWLKKQKFKTPTPEHS